MVGQVLYPGMDVAFAVWGRSREHGGWGRRVHRLIQHLGSVVDCCGGAMGLYCGGSVASVVVHQMHSVGLELEVGTLK